MTDLGPCASGTQERRGLQGTEALSQLWTTHSKRVGIALFTSIYGQNPGGRTAPWAFMWLRLVVISPARNNFYGHFPGHRPAEGGRLNYG